jgi:hypothetical protein
MDITKFSTNLQAFLRMSKASPLRSILEVKHFSRLQLARAFRDGPTYILDSSGLITEGKEVLIPTFEVFLSVNWNRKTKINSVADMLYRKERAIIEKLNSVLWENGKMFIRTDYTAVEDIPSNTIHIWEDIGILVKKSDEGAILTAPPVFFDRNNEII